ncbi:hypothetical protein ACR6C2_29295 [Streptomyces sp. INA 01156]
MRRRSEPRPPVRRTVRARTRARARAVALALGEQGSRAACTLAVRSGHVQRATAMGVFSRATGVGELPSTTTDLHVQGSQGVGMSPRGTRARRTRTSKRTIWLAAGPWSSQVPE